MSGVEALVRWQHEERGLLLPGEFLGAATLAGLAPARFWLNSSPTQLTWSGTVDKVHKVLMAHGLVPAQVGFDVPEPAIADIDRSLVQTGAEGDPILPALMSLAKMLDVTAIAEGIETEEQLDRIRRAGCVGATGNYLAPAAAAENITALLRHHRSDARM